MSQLEDPNQKCDDLAREQHKAVADFYSHRVSIGTSILSPRSRLLIS